jgi:hypothetical protein
MAGVQLDSLTLRSGIVVRLLYFSKKYSGDWLSQRRSGLVYDEHEADC